MVLIDASTAELRCEAILQGTLGEHAAYAAPVEGALAHGAWRRGRVDLAIRQVARAEAALESCSRADAECRLYAIGNFRVAEQ